MTDTAMTDTAMTDTASTDAGSRAQPGRVGLYDPAAEHDACGVAMVATLSGEPRHDIVARALVALRNLEHRGASGSEQDTGDGAGILVAVPDAFLRAVVGFALPPAGGYAVGTAFLPRDPAAAAAVTAGLHALAAEEDLRVLGWRDLPCLPELVGPTARQTMPLLRQLFLAPVGPELAGLALDRVAYRVRKRAEHTLDVYFPSLSSRTLVYKGMLTAVQLEPFFPDLSDTRFASPLALVHSRFSTNTFPSWPLAHPYRFLAHNGEINTVRGNRNWMRAREALLGAGPGSELPGELADLTPVCATAGSDSASLDEVLELLHLGGAVTAGSGAHDDPGGVGGQGRPGPGGP